MAIIGKIQEKGRYLLVGFVGLALLTFILTGLFDVLGSSVDAGNLGTIADEEVDPQLYYDNLERIERQDRMQYQQQQREYTDRDADMSADKAWNATVDELLLGKEYEALGIEVSDNELNAYLYGESGFPLMQDIAQAFADSITGQFNPKALDRFIEQRESAKDPQVINEWKETKEGLRKQRQQEKYFQLIGQGVYVTKLEAKEEYTAQKEIKSVSFVARSFREIQDEDVKITDAEIRKFYDEHKDEKKYEVLAGRDVKYFDIAIQPSKDDSVKFNTQLEKIKSMHDNIAKLFSAASWLSTFFLKLGTFVDFLRKFHEKNIFKIL